MKTSILFRVKYRSHFNDWGEMKYVLNEVIRVFVNGQLAGNVLLEGSVLRLRLSKFIPIDGISEDGVIGIIGMYVELVLGLKSIKSKMKVSIDTIMIIKENKYFF